MDILKGTLALCFAFIFGLILPLIGFAYIETRWFGGFFDNHTTTFKEFVAIFGFFIGYLLIVLKIIQLTSSTKKTKEERGEYNY